MKVSACRTAPALVSNCCSNSAEPPRPQSARRLYFEHEDENAGRGAARVAHGYLEVGGGGHGRELGACVERSARRQSRAAPPEDKEWPGRCAAHSERSEDAPPFARNVSRTRRLRMPRHRMRPRSAGPAAAALSFAAVLSLRASGLGDASASASGPAGVPAGVPTSPACTISSTLASALESSPSSTSAAQTNRYGHSSDPPARRSTHRAQPPCREAARGWQK